MKDQATCVVHYIRTASKTFKVKENGTGRLVGYGLCKACAAQIKLDPNFKYVVDRAIGERLDQFDKQKKEKEENASK